MKTNNDLFMERMEEVDGKIRAYSLFFALRAPYTEEDDLYQEAMLKLYERFSKEPEFLNSTNSYIYIYAAWMMKNYLNRERNMYVKRVVDLDTKDDEVQHRYLTGHYPRPESEAVRSEVRSIAEKMPNHYKIIYNGTVQGYKLQEIADFLNIPKTTLKWRKRVMLGRLQKAWRTPISTRANVMREMHELTSMKRVST